MTIRTSEEGFELVSVERLQMITPPQPGEVPDVRKHGGHWVELRDREGRLLAHRIIDPTMLSSVEVHSPDGKVHREFGKLKSGIIEVLLPDIEGAQEAVLVGDPVEPRRRTKRAERPRDLARFDLSSGGRQNRQ